jgi:hypothetical protein
MFLTLNHDYIFGPLLLDWELLKIVDDASEVGELTELRN